MSNDTIYRQAAIDAMCELVHHWFGGDPKDEIREIKRELEKLPSAQPKQHYCRECKWSRCHINVDKYGKSETYWRCLNWDGETDEEGYCHEWEERPGG